MCCLGATCKHIDLIVLKYQLKMLTCSWTQVLTWMPTLSLHQQSKASHVRFVRRLHFNHDIPAHNIPQGIKEIRFGDEFNQPLEGMLPTGLVKLKFGKSFNQKLKIGAHLQR